MFPQECLLFFGRPRLVGPAVLRAAIDCLPPSVKRGDQFAASASQDGCVARRRRGRNPWLRGLGHQIKVEEFNKLELDFARGGAGFEEGGHDEKTVGGFESACVLWPIEERRDQCEEGGRLNGWAVGRVQQIQEEL